MTWMVEHSIHLANAGFGVVLIALSLVLLRPVEEKRKLKNGFLILSLGIIALLLGYFFSYLTFSGMEVLTTTGASLIIVSLFVFIQYRIDIGKGKWADIHWGVRVACIIGFILIILSVVSINWPSIQS
jgi:hypothetical protein